MKQITLTAALAGALALGACATTSDYAYAPSSSAGYRYADADRYYGDYCRDKRREGQAAGAVLGGAAGAAIGAGVAGSGDRTEGAIVGGVLGAIAGSAVGRNAVDCDERGAYWSDTATIDYGEYRGYRGRYDDDWYMTRRCRWARDWRGDYVRVCPDSNGRYRMAY